MALVGRFAPHLYNTGTSYFKVRILHQCLLANIITSQMPSEVTFVIKMNPQSPLIIRYQPWTESLGICGSFTYSAKLIDDAPFPDFLKFNAISNEFIIEQTQMMKP